MTFSLKRVFDLLRVFWIIQRRSILVTAGAVYSVLFALFLFGTVTNAGWESGLEYHRVLFSTTFMIGGLIATSVSFASMHRAERSYTYLALPASHGEKFIEKLVLTAVVYPLAALLSYFVYSLVPAGVSLLLNGSSFVVFNPLQVEAFESVRVFVVAASVFLFGAAYFRSRHFIKTVLSIAALFILLSIVGATTVWMAFGDIMRDIEAGGLRGSVDGPQGFGELSLFAMRVARVARFVMMWVLPPVMWVLTWLRLREVEVSDAVQ
ncbi:MAG: hypothetical protein R6V29_08170 [Spirochaetia bacterium]